MSDINELKDAINSKTSTFALLTLATVGLYPLLWLARNSDIIAGLTKHRLVEASYLVWIAVCIGIGHALSVVQDDMAAGGGLLFSVAASALYIVWAFRAKKAIEAYCLDTFHIDLRMNAFYTLMFNVFYVNYCINDLAEVQRRQSVLRSHPPVV
jgi:hypothetical protein